MPSPSKGPQVLQTLLSSRVLRRRRHGYLETSSPGPAFTLGQSTDYKAARKPGPFPLRCMARCTHRASTRASGSCSLNVPLHTTRRLLHALLGRMHELSTRNSLPLLFRHPFSLHTCLLRSYPLHFRPTACSTWLRLWLHVSCQSIPRLLFRVFPYSFDGVHIPCLLGTRYMHFLMWTMSLTAAPPIPVPNPSTLTATTSPHQHTTQSP